MLKNLWRKIARAQPCATTGRRDNDANLEQTETGNTAPLSNRVLIPHQIQRPLNDMMLVAHVFANKDNRTSSSEFMVSAAQSMWRIFEKISRAKWEPKELAEVMAWSSRALHATTAVMECVRVLQKQYDNPHEAPVEERQALMKERVSPELFFLLTQREPPRCETPEEANRRWRHLKMCTLEEFEAIHNDRLT